MTIDQRDIEKGSLTEILSKFYPDSISYLSELNEYRMYAEVWSNKRSDVTTRRREIGHEGYLRTLEYGERKKKRKSDRVRFDYFAVADSVNYMVEKNLYGDLNVYIQMGGIKDNTILSDVIKSKSYLFKTRPSYPLQTFHSKSYLPKTIDVDLKKLGLRQDENSNKFYFEISTNSNEITNQYQQMILLQILGKNAISDKLPLLYEAGRKHIRCLFENPEYLEKRLNTPDAISRLCVAWPFKETIIFDFAGRPEEYNEVCLLGVLIKAKDHTEGGELIKIPLVDGYV
jgi:hypothetical protein